MSQYFKKKEKKGHILVVDDMPIVAETIKEVIDDYDVTSVHNGKGAIKQLSERTYDLVILDVKMPCMSGLEVIKVIQQMHPDLPVIIHTGYADDFPEKEIMSGYNPFSYVEKGQIEKLISEIDRAYDYYKDVVESTKNKIFSAFEKEETCPFSVLFDALYEKVFIADNLPKKKSDTSKLIRDMVIPFCRISPLILHLEKDKKRIICTCLKIWGETYNVFSYLISSKECEYYHINQEIIKEFVKTKKMKG